MAKVQKYFEQFHELIRTDFDVNATLREKRDIILERIRKHLAEKERPGIRPFDQGSYATKTGTVPPTPLEFDIDEGLRFEFKDSEYEASAVRRWIFEAVDGHTDKVEDKGPCVRVIYAEPTGYHVDLVAYAVWSEAGVDLYRLAHKMQGWRPADPPKLIEHIRERRKPFADTEDQKTKTDQFRRVVRYLKRWGDHQVPTDRADKPTGLAFTLLCCQSLSPRKDWSDQTPDDRAALAALARAVGNLTGRIVAKKPTPEYEDMFERINEEEMRKLKARFLTLADRLDEAGREPDPVKACTVLREVFGPDFPVPDPEETGKKSTAPAIITSSSSA
jgi:hypothetical protein